MARRTSVWSTLAGLATLTGALTGCASDGNGPTATDQVVAVIPTAGRERVAPFAGELLDGSNFESASTLGSVVVYNVWGSWCAPCRTEAATLQRVSEESRNLGVRFVGINVRDNDASARAFEDGYSITYPSITSATSGDALLAFGPALPPSAVPSTMVVDAEGRLAARIIGPVDYTTLSTLVTDTADERAAADD